MTTEPISQPYAEPPYLQRAIRCGGCEAWWTGDKTCHCATCHQTFTALTNFDRHRRGGACHHPAEVGLHLTTRPYPCWAAPETRYIPEEESA